MKPSVRLQFFGSIKAVADDDVISGLRCGDKDTAFALVAVGPEDVVGLESGPTPEPGPAGADPVDAQVRLLFHCEREADRTWLLDLCQQQGGTDMACIEVDPARRRALLSVRIPEGVRLVSVSPAG